METRRILPDGAVAEFVSDTVVDGGLYLTIDGVIQSHLIVSDPRSLFLDYQHRFDAAIKALIPLESQPRFLHLGAGALTLARAVSVRYPTANHTIVELHHGLIDFVLSTVPFPGGSSHLTAITADALEALKALRVSDEPRFDVIVCDLYGGTTTPPHLTTVAFYQAAAELLTSTGTILINVADGPNLKSTRHCVANITALGQIASSEIVAIGPADLITGKTSGNAVVIASKDNRFGNLLPGILAAGPHPAAALTKDQ